MLGSICSLRGKLMKALNIPVVVGDDLCYKSRRSPENFFHVQIEHLHLSLSLLVAFVGKARK